MVHKRQRKAKKAEAKRPKCKDTSCPVDEVANDAIALTKITDINNDCLAHICNYLSLADLLHLCDASKRFEEAAGLSLKTKYYVTLKEIKPSTNRLLKVPRQFITICDLSQCLKFLRNFGHKIKTLTVDYNGIAQNHCAAMDRYINEYCTETLTSIHIHHAKPHSMSNINNIFSELSAVKFYNCELSYQLTNFEKWFPKMETIFYHGLNKVIGRNCFEKRIPSLKYLSIEIVTKEDGRSQVGKSKLAQILRSNPQIVDLTINGSGLDANGLKSISEALGKLGTLKLRLSKHFVNGNMDTIHLKNVTSLTIQFDSSFNEFPEIPLSFDRLDRLKISSTNAPPNENFMNFITKQKSLKSLNLMGWKDTTALKNTISSERLENVVHSLQALSSNCKFSTDEVILYLDKCGDKLKVFCCTHDGNSNLDTLKERLPAEWNDYRNFRDQYIRLNRRLHGRFFFKLTSMLKTPNTKTQVMDLARDLAHEMNIDVKTLFTQLEDDLKHEVEIITLGIE